MKKIIACFLAISLLTQFVAPSSAKAGVLNDIFKAISSYFHNKPHNTHTNGAPIDGGLSLLLVAGVGLGAKKMADRNKKKKSQTVNPVI